MSPRKNLELEDTFESDGASISNSSTEEERKNDFNEGELTNMNATSQASLLTEVPDEELDRYLEMHVHLHINLHQFHHRHH